MTTWGETWPRLEADGWQLWHEPTEPLRWVVRDPAGAWWAVPSDSGGRAARKALVACPERARRVSLRMALGLGLGDASVTHAESDPSVAADVAGQFRRGLS